MEQIIIIDDVLPSPLAKDLEKLTMDISFPWFMQRDIYESKLENEEEHRAASDKNTVNTIQLGHFIYNSFDKEGPKDNSTLWPLCEHVLGHIAEKLPEPFVTIIPIQVKFNLLFNNTKCLSTKYNTPHVDNKWWDSYSMIYYVNSADGDTIIFNEEYGPDVKEKPEEFTIKQRILPQHNRIVIFKGTHYHTSSNPIKSDHRIVLNTTFYNHKIEVGNEPHEKKNWLNPVSGDLNTAFDGTRPYEKKNWNDTNKERIKKSFTVQEKRHG